MSSIISNDSSASVLDTTSQAHNSQFALVTLTALFFMWGVITCLNDILIPHFKNLFSLSYTQAMLIQFCFFGAYFIVSIPAGEITKRLGYQHGIVLGLLICSIGCFLFYPAAMIQSYTWFLGALFILASGVTLLQVSANPYVTVLGNPETASSRLTLTQAFNSLGTTIAPFLGAFFILSSAVVVQDSLSAEQLADFRTQEANAVKLPYLILAGLFFVLSVIFLLLKLPKISFAKENMEAKGRVWDHPHLLLGALGIFLYVGAEVSIGSFLVNFLGEDNIAGLPESQAAHYVAYYWGGAMLGRFIGAAAMYRFAPGKVLAFNASITVMLLFVAIAASGPLAMWSILAVGLFNSIMFPTIFSLALRKLGSTTHQGSGLLCLAVVGGAIIPLLQGWMADTIGIQLAFCIPVLCYCYIVYYGLKGLDIKV